MKILILVLLLDLLATLSFSGNVNRFKRGFLSRTGLCPDPSRNFQKRDRRLNYFGNAIVIKKGGNKEVTCLESECVEDSHCDADRKCCKNRCGGMVCTRTVRDPDPCENFACPPQQTCKIQKVKCIMPECKDAYALNRPTCVPDSEATALQNDDNRLSTASPVQTTAGATYNKMRDSQYQQSYYDNNQQISGINSYASTPSTSYYAANQLWGNNYGQEYNWQQNNYQQQQG